ncbi:MAG: RagB/SusD family nutrient uptake outer membrane protein [Rufibacter sp.]
MRMIKNISKPIVLAALAFNISACSDFLDLENANSLDVGTTVRDLPSLTNASNGVYSGFQSAGYYNRTFILLPDLMTDNAFVSRQNVGFYTNYDALEVNNQDGYANGAWASMYSLIANANLAIASGERLTLNPLQQNTANQIIGEMYAARALAHFDLVRFFAKPYNATADASHFGVPIITAPQTEIISPSRATVQQVYAQIIRDFEKSLQLMAPNGEKYRKNGRFTPDAAKALLAKVYLYMGNWAEAERYATEVISGGTYSLIPNNQYQNSWRFDFSTESIFEIENTNVDKAGVNGIGMMYEQGQYGDILTTADLYNTYALTDVRRTLIQVGRRGIDNPAYIVHKYPKGLSTQDDNIKVIRLAEVYLIRAEARAEQGKNDLAQDDLFEVMKRADPTALKVLLTGPELVDRILLERRKELAFEGNRLFDLTRKKKDVNLIRATSSTIIPYNDNRLILPIPIAEINANPNIAQNPGYL